MEQRFEVVASLFWGKRSTPTWHTCHATRVSWNVVDTVGPTASHWSTLGAQLRDRQYASCHSEAGTHHQTNLETHGPTTLSQLPKIKKCLKCSNQVATWFGRHWDSSALRVIPYCSGSLLQPGENKMELQPTPEAKTLFRCGSQTCRAHHANAQKLLIGICWCDCSWHQFAFASVKTTFQVLDPTCKKHLSKLCKESFFQT